MRARTCPVALSKTKRPAVIPPLASFSINAAALTKATSSRHAHSPLLVFCGVDPSSNACLQLYSTITAKLLLKFSTVSLVVLHLSALYMYFRNYFHLEIFPTIHTSLGKVSLPLARFLRIVFEGNRERARTLGRPAQGACPSAREPISLFRACKQIITQRSVLTFNETISDERTQHPW